MNYAFAFYVFIWYNYLGDKVKYPGGLKKSYSKNVVYSNRGMQLESVINEANSYYLENDLAVIYKKATPITVLKTKDKQITNGFYKEKSTLDYVGIYKGRYIEFDAKETKASSLALKNIHPHQLNHIQKVISHGGISFLIISINDEYYLVDGKIILEFVNTNERKSLTYEFIKKNGKKLTYNYLKGLMYLKELEELF